MNNHHDSERQLPTPRPDLLTNEFRDGKTRHQKLPRAPIRAVNAKAQQLRNAIRNNNPLDYADLYERFVDLWHEARLVIWRAKHSKAGLKHYDPETQQDVLTFVSDDKVVLQAIDTCRNVLDSMIKLRREIGSEPDRIPHWAIAQIEAALRHHPAALNALLKALAADNN
jgi:hypothetical protein